MRGDRPPQPLSYVKNRWFTPHARGSTRILQSEDRLLQVYPACAGIDLDYAINDVLIVRLPRMRGDRPYSAIFLVVWL